MVEERLVAGTEVVLAWLAIGRGREPVLWAAPTASESHIAVETELGQSLEFVPAELALVGRSHQLDHVPILDVAKQVFRLDKVIARVQVAGVLDGKLEPARLGVNAHTGRLSVPIGESGIEHLH